MRQVIVLALLLGACDDRGPAPMDDCGGDLRGVWEGEAVTWHAIVGGDAWELFPMYDERPAGVPAPGVIDLFRQPPGAPTLVGTYTRRYQDGAARCDVKTAVTLRECKGDHVVLEVTLPAAPTDFATCAGGGAGAIEAWTLTRRR